MTPFRERDRVRWYSPHANMGMGTVEKTRLLVSVRWDNQHDALEYDAENLRLVSLVPVDRASETPELLALREVERAAQAYIPYPALTFDERHEPRREALILALANAIKARRESGL